MFKIRQIKYILNEINEIIKDKIIKYKLDLKSRTVVKLIFSERRTLFRVSSFLF